MMTMADPPHPGNGDVEALMDKAREMPVAQPVAAKVDKHGPGPYLVACPECSAPMLWSSIRNHRERKHGVPRTFRYNQRYYQSLRIEGEIIEEPGRRRRIIGSNMGRPGTYKPPKKSDTPVSQPAAPKSPKRPEPLDAQAVIEAVLTSLFPKNIPVTKVGAVTRWAAATERFIEEAEL